MGLKTDRAGRDASSLRLPLGRSLGEVPWRCRERAELPQVRLRDAGQLGANFEAPSTIPGGRGVTLRPLLDIAVGTMHS